MRVVNVSVLVLMVIIIWGCKSNPSNSDSDNPDGNIESELNCERFGYPCSLSDVSEEVYEATNQVLQEAVEIRQNGNMDDVREYFESHDRIEEVEGDESAIWFRLTGGTPAWFLDATSAVGAEEGINKNHFLSESKKNYSVVGEDQNGDNKVNNRDHKRVLVMAPYYWQFSPNDQSPFIAERLELIEEYEGNVTYKSNPSSNDQNISVENYMDWNDYDAIFLSTHGKRLCVQSDTYCEVLVATGIRVPRDRSLGDIQFSTGASTSIIYNQDETLQSNSELRYILNADFFRTVYSSGLDNTFLYFSACQIGGDGASELADAMGGDNFVMMGWTEVVGVKSASTASTQMLFELENGLSAKDALQNVEAAGFSPLVFDVRGNAVTTSLMHFAPSGGDQRIIELPELQKDGEKVEDGTNLSDDLEGTAGDGEPDKLTLTSRIDGIEEGKTSDYKVRYFMDDEEASTVYGLNDATRINDYSVEVTHEVDLGFDAPLQPELEIVVDLPEGGESRYAAKVKLESVCEWQMTLSGPDGGSFESDVGFAVLGTPTNIILSQSASSTTNLTGATMQINQPLPENVPAALTLGLSGDQQSNPDGFLTVMVNGQTEFKSGNGGPYGTAQNPTDTFPEPAELIITKKEPNEISGSVTGELWADPEPGEEQLRKASVLLDFTIKNNGTCIISDPQNP